ncbi:MAG: hypothetical protein KME25_25245 [Symplocastrum torsivum CPER-KK1]|uniref:Uncharacterized protein n=1 Tax=Symplocastrum torsivum CPER-KK1 TaxID=450513 RepID=A0A951PP92_9CYAN|nr:hypothetical protein [Symplocastrum torsivum CPER-KK1]
MTFQKDIQSLIADIDGILPKAGSRLPWSKPGDIAQERRVLERVRSYLVSLQQNGAVPEQRPANPALPEGVKEIVEAVTQEMDFLRADLLHPLLEDMEALRQERESLMHEIKQLQRTRQQLDSPTSRHPAQPPMTADFSQELISRCTESLTSQMTQLFANLEARLASPGSAIAMSTPQGKLGGVLQSQDRVEQLRQIQDQSDQMLLALDANQQKIFETLQCNLQGYQKSMAQGLEKMHGLSVQGELLFTALVNRLAEQLGRETTTTSDTQPVTVLPSNATGLRDSSLTPLPPLPLQPPETLSSAPESATDSFSSPDALPNLSSISPTSAPTLDRSIQPTPEETLLENLNSDNWEIIEELELNYPTNEPDEDDGLATFIQLDIEPSTLPASVESDPTAENLPISPSAEETGVGEASKLTSSFDSHGREIDDLYETLFGTDSSASRLRATEAEVPVATDSATPVSSQVENVLFEGLSDPAVEPTESQASNWSGTDSSDSWEVLFFEDTATQPPSESELAENQYSSEPASSSTNTNGRQGVETIAALTDLFDEMRLTHLLPTVEPHSIPEQPSEPPTANSEPPTVDVVEDNYIPALPEEDLLAMDALETELDPEVWLNQNALQQLQQDLSRFEGSEGQDLQSQDDERSLFDYSQAPLIAPEIPNSHQTNYRFLASQELLAEDWEDFVYHDLSDEDAISQNLADSPQNDSGEEIATIASDNGITQPSPSAAPESIESDFDPDLFPSEALELDHENTLSASSEAPEEIGVPRELNALEDETFVEMLWDEPVDSTTEEMISSPDLEFETNVFPQTPQDLQRENLVNNTLSDTEAERDRSQSNRLDSELIAPDHEALDEPVVEGSPAKVPPQSSPEYPPANPTDLGLNILNNQILSADMWNDAPNNTQEIVLPPEPVETQVDPLREASLDAGQQEAVAQPSGSEDPVVSEDIVMPEELVVADNEALAEVELSDRLAQEAQTSSETEFDTTLPQPKTTNPEQPNNQKGAGSGE